MSSINRPLCTIPLLVPCVAPLGPCQADHVWRVLQQKT